MKCSIVGSIIVVCIRFFISKLSVITHTLPLDLQQSTEPKCPEVLLIAINKNGLMLIDPRTKV